MIQDSVGIFKLEWNRNNVIQYSYKQIVNTDDVVELLKAKRVFVKIIKHPTYVQFIASLYIGYSLSEVLKEETGTFEEMIREGKKFMLTWSEKQKLRIELS